MGGPCVRKRKVSLASPSDDVVAGLELVGGKESSAGFFPFLCLGALKGEAVGSMWYLCNLTIHVMRKTRDSVYGVSKSANCTWRENRGEEAWI